jgi:WD40 repeat protein
VDWGDLDYDSLIEARIWDLATRKAVGVPLRHQMSGTVSVAWSKDSQQVATAVRGLKSASLTLGSSQARVWEVKTGAPITPVLTFDVFIQAMEFSPDGKLLAVASGNGWELAQVGDVRILDSRTGVSRIPPIPTPYTCRTVRFSPDGSRLVTASGGDFNTEGEARIWDVASGKPVTPPLLHTGAVHTAEFSPDGYLVLTGSEDGTAQIWDATTGARSFAPMRHQYPVHSAIFSRDGRLVLTTSSPTGWLAENRAYAQVWDATTGQPVTPPFWHTRAITSAVFSPDGRSVATTSNGDEAQVWRLTPDRRPLDDWLRLAQVLSGTKLDASGALRPIDRSELREAFQALRSKDPGVFTSSQDQVLGWHDQEARDYEIAGAWEATVGHLNHLIGAGRDLDSLRHRRARAHAELEHWSEAAEDYHSQGLSDRACFHDWFSLALLELGRDHRDSYRAACSAMLRLFGNGDSAGETAEFTAWTLALAPGSVDDYHPVIALAERLRAAQPKSQMAASALGALLYRAGRFEKAAAQLTEASLLNKNPLSSPVYIWFFLAMAHHRLDHAALAKTWCDKAVAATEQALANHARGSNETLPWRRRLTLKLLRQEAEALIRPDEFEMMPNGAGAFAR